MPIQRCRRSNLHIPDPPLYLIDNTRQISLQMDAKSKEIGNHQNVMNTPCRQRFHGAFQAGFTQFQKCRFYDFEPPGADELSSDGAHRFISRFQAGAVGENDDSGGQVPWMYACI